MAIDPTDAQANALGGTPQDQPVIFLNCHKYHAHARYQADYENPDLPPDVSGRDEVVIGEYPSKSEAFRMQALPGYADINVHRLAGLQHVQTLSFNQHDLERLTIPDAWRNRS